MKFTASSYAGKTFSKERIEMDELSQITFSNCVFRWTDFTDVGVFYHCVFESCDFTYARLNGVDIKNCRFLSCTFRNASFFAATLDDCTMTGSDFSDADCAMLEIIGGDWSYANLRKQSFQKQKLSNVRFYGANLTACHFNQCEMNACEFDDAIVHETSFYRCDLRGSTIEGMNILGANFKEAKLDIRQCVIIAEFVTDGKYTPEDFGKGDI